MNEITCLNVLVGFAPHPASTVCELKLELMQTASEAHTKKRLDCLDQCLITAPVQTDEDVTPSAARLFLPSCSLSSGLDMKNLYYF